MTPVDSTIEMPPRIARLPVHRGFPVPWFVAWIDGQPDFRVIRPGGVVEAVEKSKCWVCGGLLLGKRAYVIGPMCAVNRTSAEPSSHIDCARYSAKACPFLARPHARRREAGMPEEVNRDDVPGLMLDRNPGVALVWITGLRVTTFRDPRGGLLFDVGRPLAVEWYAEGREATRAEVQASIDSGLPALQQVADQEGPGASAELARYVERAMTLLPAA